MADQRIAAAIAKVRQWWTEARVSAGHRWPGHPHWMECELQYASDEMAALRERLAKLERVREALASGFAMKTHDLAMHESWVIDDVDEVRAALDDAKD